MIHSEPLAKRSLQTRLALAYAAGIFAAGILVLVIVDLPLVGIRSTKPVGPPAASAVAKSGVAPHELLVGSAIAVAVLIAGRFLQPLRAITATARAISPGNLHQRVDLGQPSDELTELGHTLDDLFARLQSFFDAQRHFVANASHELRTPLAGLRTLLEVILADPRADAETLRSICEEALALGGHQERLIQALLALATSERGVIRWDSIDLSHIAHHVVAARCNQSTSQGIHLIERLTPASTVGDPILIESLVANLVDNAILHNRRDGFVEIATHTAGTRATIAITNSGPVIADDQLQRLLQPFQRLSPDRNGHHDGYGLGLAIVNAVTRAHHATLTARGRPEGGLSIHVDFASPVDAITM